MQAKTSLYQTIEAGPHHVEYKLSIAGTDIPASYIQSLSLEGALFADYSFGHCDLRSANLTVQGNYHAGDELIVYARIANATQQSEWIRFCTLIIFSRELVDETYSVMTAYDVLGKTEYQFKQTEIWQNMTFLEAVRSIFTTIGATIVPAAESRIPNGTISSDPQSMTAREVLQHIAAAAGANWCTRADGRVDLIPITVPSSVYGIAAGDTKLNSYHQNQTYSAFVGVELEGESLVYRSPSGLTEAQWQALKRTGRIMDGVSYWATQEMADDILTTLTGATQFSPWYADINADICAELGDGITIGSISSIYGYYSLDASGGRLFGEIGAHGISNIEYLQQYVPAIERRLVYQGRSTRASITVLDDRVTSEVAELNGDIVETQTQVTQNATGISVLTQYQNDQENYMQYDGTVPVLKIGVAGENVHAEMRQDGFAIVDGAEESVFSDGKLTTNIVHAETETQTGRWAWVDEGIDGFSLIFME